MCTLILGRGVTGPGEVILAANRDEDPARPSGPPQRLRAEPVIAGGRDARAGGTWLAVRRDAVVAMLNRRPVPDARAATRSRGLLAIDVAAAGPDRARERAAQAVRDADYAPFSLVHATPRAAWILVWNGGARIDEIPAGWHVITHSDLDDRSEPRTARLLEALRDFRPADAGAAERRLLELLALHDDPAVCIHTGPMRTVSFALVRLGAGAARYLHGEGPPCTTTPADYSHLLADPVPDASAARPREGDSR